MFSWSISRTDAAPTPTAVARARMIGARRSRWATDRVFESRTPGIRWQPGFMITAAATTAPQVGATPTSSTPATRVRPSFHRRRSWRRVGTMTAIGGQGSRSGRSARNGPVRIETTPAMPGSEGGRVGRQERDLAVRAPLAEGRGLADAIAQEVQLRSPDLAVPDDLDLLDPRAVDLERPLDADAARDPADRDRAGDPAAAQAHHDAFEDLDPLAVALDDLGGDLDRVAGGELGKVGAQLVGDEFVEDVHFGVPCFVRRQPEAAGGTFTRK